MFIFADMDALREKLLEETNHAERTIFRFRQIVGAYDKREGEPDHVKAAVTKAMRAAGGKVAVERDVAKLQQANVERLFVVEATVGDSEGWKISSEVTDDGTWQWYRSIHLGGHVVAYNQKRYGPGKFANYAEEFVYELSLDTATSDTKDVIGRGCATLVEFEEPEKLVLDYVGRKLNLPDVITARSAIVFEDDHGVLSFVWYSIGGAAGFDFDKLNTPSFS